MIAARRETDQTRTAYNEAMNSNRIYENFLDALSDDYFDLYYVDIDSDEFIEYGSETEIGHLSNIRHGTDFFEDAKKTGCQLYL